MRYVYNQAKETTDPTFLLLHGTGGRETELLPVAQRADVNNGILAVRGNVNENGYSRYFKRFTDGSLDETDLIDKTNELNQFINEASHHHNFDRNNVIAIGYSNGANIASSLLFHHENALKGAILFHPLVPRRDIELPDLSGTNIFISTGATDSLVLPGESMELKKMLEGAGANVKFHITDFGHELVDSEVKAAVEWYEEHTKDFKNTK